MRTIEHFTNEQVASAFPADLKDRTPLDVLETLITTYNDLAQQSQVEISMMQFHTLYVQIQFYINLLKEDKE